MRKLLLLFVILLLSSPAFATLRYPSVSSANVAANLPAWVVTDNYTSSVIMQSTLQLITPGEPGALIVGTGNNKIYEADNDTMVFYVGGTSRWIADQNYFGSSTSTRARFRNVTSTLTNPNITPDGSDSDSGMSHGGANQIGLTAGAKPVIVIEPGIATINAEMNVTGAVYINDLIALGSDGFTYYLKGGKVLTTNDNYRTGPSGNNLITERRESGAWVEKHAITP